MGQVIQPTGIPYSALVTDPASASSTAPATPAMVQGAIAGAMPISCLVFYQNIQPVATVYPISGTVLSDPHGIIVSGVPTVPAGYNRVQCRITQWSAGAYNNESAVSVLHNGQYPYPGNSIWNVSSTIDWYQGFGVTQVMEFLVSAGDTIEGLGFCPNGAVNAMFSLTLYPMGE